MATDAWHLYAFCHPRLPDSQTRNCNQTSTYIYPVVVVALVQCDRHKILDRKEGS